MAANNLTVNIKVDYENIGKALSKIARDELGESGIVYALDNMRETLLRRASISFDCAATTSGDWQSIVAMCHPSRNPLTNGTDVITPQYIDYLASVEIEQPIPMELPGYLVELPVMEPMELTVSQPQTVAGNEECENDR